MTTELTPTAELLQKQASRGTPSRAIVIALALAGAIAFGGVGFAVGRVTAPSPTFAGFRNGGNGSAGLGGDGQRPGNFGGGGGLGAGRGFGLQGTVTSIGGDTLTLKTANGSTITVKMSSSTTYSKQITGQQSDITQGSTVRVGINFAAGANPGSGTVDATSLTLVTP
jgi:hypothetical protein